MRHRLGVLFLLALGIPLACRLTAGGPGPARWYKGNTHTHTLWSDGDAPPEQVSAWYKDHGYHFLVLSDHNIIADREKWAPVGTAARQVPPDRVPTGSEVRERDGKREFRLKTLGELEAAFGEEGRFLFIRGEEITDKVVVDKVEKHIHHNSMNHTHLIAPAGGATVREALERTIAAVEEEARKCGRTVLVHLNHPNFHWSVTAEDLAHVKGERYFEVYNGHRGVRNHGDAEHLSTEAIWDTVLTMRLARLGGPVLYGLATDDAHNYHKEQATANPGRGWIQVRARELSPDAIVEAMLRGDFYGSSGVTLLDFGSDGTRLRVSILPEPGVAHVTRFIGTRVRDGQPGPPGELLAEVAGTEPSYAFRGDELYVRAVVVSSRKHANGYAPGDFESAWVQPVELRRLVR
jgi:hypothetical protein